MAATCKDLYRKPDNRNQSSLHTDMRNQMTRELLEIVELPDGRIVLRRSEQQAPIVTLTFSKEARAFLKERYIEVAKSMFHAGLQTAGQLQGEEVAVEEIEDLEDLDMDNHTLH